MTTAEIVHCALLAVFFGIGARLSHIDILEHRLPNALVLPLATATAVGVGALSLIGQHPGGMVRAVAGGVVLAAFHGVLRAAGGGLGGGDVKLALPVGLLLAFHGWSAFAVGAVGAFAIGAVVAIAMIATGRATRRTRIAFGPCMILAACAALILT